MALDIVAKKRTSALMKARAALGVKKAKTEEGSTFAKAEDLENANTEDMGMAQPVNTSDIKEEAKN